MALTTAHMITLWLAQSSNVTAHCAGGFRGGGLPVHRSAIRSGGSAVGQRTLYHSIGGHAPYCSAQNLGQGGVLLAAMVMEGLLMLMLVMLLQQYLFAGNTGGARDRIYRSCADLSVHRVTSIGHLLGDGSYVGLIVWDESKFAVLLVIAVCFLFRPTTLRAACTHRCARIPSRWICCR